MPGLFALGDLEAEVTVGELRQALEGVADDVLVVQAGDEEGNDFKLTSDLERSLCSDATGGRVEVATDIHDGAVCVVLWPVG